MKKELNVDVHHLTRVEGHGNIRVRVEDGELVEARWDVVETPRFFEVMLKGKHYTSAGILTARIGLAALDLCRPVPFLTRDKPALADFMREIVSFEADRE